jgi:hypothetical protein
LKKNNPASSSQFRLPVLIFTFLFGLISQAQDSIYKERQENRDSIVIASEQGNFSLSFKDKDILETRFIPDAGSSDSMVVHMGNGDQDLKLNISEVADSLSLSSEGIEILIKKEPFGITYNFQQLWMDFGNGKRHLPGSRVTVKSKDDIIPMLVRSGAIFPVVEEEKYGEPNEHLQLHYVFSSEVKKKQKDTCISQGYGDYCYDIIIEGGNSLNITIKRENLPLDKRGEEPDLEEVDFVVHPVNRKVAFIWVNGIKYTGKNYMHEGKLIVPLNFREDRAELKVDWQ